ncbi:hypothetical protein BT96DRAFT_943315 [Gymnopus androsaceus JB14]|uniref:Uncharacterized protein n=1 Tax=Gymnopus androsaceus JB14 TaxID=1447944 RepID=A0A6A4H7P5_9AGAR|nr:hypothetical protein BT96DRAFT_943315 [Gymnopus androsaceus JB14]
MVQWVLEGQDVMTTVLGPTNTPQIIYPNPYPYDIKKPQTILRDIYQSIAGVSGIVGGRKHCRPQGRGATQPCHILVGEDAREDPLFGIISTTKGKGLSLRGSLAIASFSSSPTQNVKMAVIKVAKSSESIRIRMGSWGTPILYIMERYGIMITDWELIKQESLSLLYKLQPQELRRLPRPTPLKMAAYTQHLPLNMAVYTDY